MDPAPRKSRLKQAAQIFAYTAITLGGLGFFLRVLDKVLSGHGLDTYRTYWLVEFNYIGALVSMMTLPIVGLIGWYFVHREKRLEQDLLRKYGKKDASPK